MSKHNSSRPRRRVLVAVAAGASALGLFGSGALVWTASQAAFSDTTTNGPNSWEAGTVALTDDDGGVSVMFNIQALAPGHTGERCILVTYNGSLAGDVKLYGASTAADLSPYLDLTIQQGTGGTFSGSGGGVGSCTGFVADNPAIFSTTAPAASAGTLEAFVTDRHDFATGVGSWAPTAAAPGQSKVYRFSYTLKNDNAAQGKNADATFTWEALNT